MAPVPKKTYSRIKINETCELNESDPFDKLLSSPLKQDVDFKPLSFWRDKIEEKLSDGSFNNLSNSSSESGNARKLVKMWKTQRVHHESGVASGRIHRSHMGISNSTSSKLKKDVNKSCENHRQSLDIGLDHYQYITFKRGMDYPFPRVWNQFHKGIAERHAGLGSKIGLSDLDSTDEWKTCAVNEVNPCEDDSEEDSTLKCTVIVADENNNTTWNMIEAFGTSENSSIQENLENSVVEDETSKLKPSSPLQPVEFMNTIISGVSDMKISCPKSPPLRNITTRRHRNRHTLDGQNKSTMMRDMTKNLKPKTSLRRFEVSKLNNSPVPRGKENKFRVSLEGSKDDVSFSVSRLSGMTNPIFESTRIGPEQNEEVDLAMTVVEVPSCLETSVALRPGKQWRRSMSVLRKLQNESHSTDRLLCSGIKGRHYETFVRELMELQEDAENIAEEHSDSICDVTAIEQITNNVTTASPRQGGVDSSLASLSSVKNKTMLNHTVKVIENSFEKSSIAFRTAMENQNNISVLEGDSMDKTTVSCEELVSAREIILEHCSQTDILPFEDHFNERTLKNCRKIGEGVFGEVFMTDDDTVFKVIPIEGEAEVNGEPQKKFEEILSEVIIASKLSDLREEGDNQSPGFSKMKKCWCVYGKYPKHLLDLWREYDTRGNGSENDSPEMFKSDQLYIVLELENGGKDLESFEFNSAEQSLAIFVQTAFTLAVAERVFQFEHRDLHWGNLLIKKTQKKYMTVVLDGVRYKLPTKGVVVSIIDFTLSRILHAGCCLFNDLSVDPTLFTSQGDYQFEIYRMMQRELGNDWSLFRPRTNIYWLHYILDKMLKMVRYKNRGTIVHKKFLKEIKILESVVLEHENCSDFVLNMGLGN